MLKNLWAAVLIGLHLAFLPLAAQGQQRNFQVAPAQSAEKRVALVIGNNDYRSVTRLERAVSDARAMGTELRRLGFEVLQHANLDRRGMNLAVSELVDKVAGGGVAVLFFAGHGVQVSGSNFLLPVDIRVGRADELTDEAIDLGRVMERLSIARAKFTLLIVDACRDNPFPRVAGRSVGGSRGLSIPSAPDGLMVVYSAGINEQALDKLDERDRDPNGLFTREFIKQLRQPGVRVDDMVRRVRASVREQAQRIGHVQNPAIYDQSNGDFYFMLPQGGTPVASLAPALAAPAPDPAAVEISFWDSIKDSKNPAEIRTYLDQYPEGRFATLAKVRLGSLAPVAPKPLAADPAGDRAFWDSIKDSRNPEELKAYLQQFPGGLFSTLAQARLKSLQSTQVATAAPSTALARAPAQVVNSALISEIVRSIESNYVLDPDFRTVVRGAAEGLEKGALKGKLTVAGDADSIVVNFPARGPPVSLGRTSGASDASRQLALLGNLAHEAEPSLGAAKIEEALLRGGMSALDLHSDFLSREAFKELQVGTQGVFGGLGIEVGMKDGWLNVVTPIEGTPAARAGINPNDRIVTIDGFPTHEQALDALVRRMRGQPGTRVTLGIEREGWSAPRDFPIIRETIRVQSVRSRELEPGMGYIRIAQFQQGTAQALQEVIDGWAGGFLRSARVRGLVLDLRNDPGGLLNSAVDVASKFLPEGQVVVTTHGRSRDSRMTLSTKSSGNRIDVPMVVLVNEGSASASEILAGALQDLNRAVVMGNRTFGKGSVQTIVPVSGGYALKLTTAEYRTPKGRGINLTGLEPDIVVPGKMPSPLEKEPDVQLQAAMARLKEMMAGR